MGWLATSTLFHFDYSTEAQQIASHYEVVRDQRRSEWAKEQVGRKKEHQKEIENLNAVWDKKTTEQKERHRRGLWGDPLEEALKNPKLTIREMLLQSAQASAPSNAQVDVKVDRFTEFDIFVALKDRPEPAQLARVVRVLLGKNAKYVNSVRFVYGDQLIWFIDRRKIDSIPSWEDLSFEAIANAVGK